MKVAYIGSKPAYPKVDGGCFASAAFLQNLIDSDVETHYITIGTEKHPFDLSSFPERILAKVKVAGLNISTKLKPFDALKFLIKKGSYNVERFYSFDFEKVLIGHIEREAFDVVIFDNVFTARYLDVFKRNGVKCFVRSHNVEFEVWETISKNTSKPLKRWYLNKLSRDLKTFELTALNSVDGIMTLSEDDENTFRSFGITTSITTIPVSIAIPQYEHNYSNANFFHFGAMNWKPNIRAVNNALSIWDDVRSQSPDCLLTIAGNHSDQYFEGKNQEGVKCAGFVSSIKEFFNEQGILISLIDSGSGVRIKILEAMSYGIPIITTPPGAKGISDTGGIRTVNSKNEILKAIYELHTDENKRKELGVKAKSIINLHHNPKTISEKVLEFIDKA